MSNVTADDVTAGILENKDEIIKFATEYAEGFNDDDEEKYSLFHMWMLCQSLGDLMMSDIFGVRLGPIFGRLVAGEITDEDSIINEHYWLEFAGGQLILDPMADRFEELGLPPVYLGEKPEAYVEYEEK